jgi:hypothetical protein
LEGELGSREPKDSRTLEDAGTNRPPTRRMHNRSLIEAAAAAVVFTTLAFATLALHPTVRSESRGYDRDSRGSPQPGSASGTG